MVVQIKDRRDATESLKRQKDVTELLELALLAKGMSENGMVVAGSTVRDIGHGTTGTALSAWHKTGENLLFE